MKHNKHTHSHLANNKRTVLKRKEKQKQNTKQTKNKKTNSYNSSKAKCDRINVWYVDN